MRLHIKQFPLGNFSQTVVTAIMEARKFVKDSKDIAEVHIRTSKKALNIMADAPEKWRPPNSETADHSIPYTAGGSARCTAPSTVVTSMNNILR